jgi:hypothetical protein
MGYWSWPYLRTATGFKIFLIDPFILVMFKVSILLNKTGSLFDWPCYAPDPIGIL